jgi:hypothetical protein
MAEITLVMRTGAISVNKSPVPLHYSNLFSDGLTMDDEGVELADDEAARAHAVKSSSSSSDTVLHGHLAGRPSKG